MAEKRVVVLDVQTGQAQKNVQELNKDLKNTSTNLDGVSSAADQATGGAITKFKTLIGTLRGVTTGFKTLRGAIIATGIGALVIGITSLVAAFNSSEEGQNKFAKILGVIGALTGNLVDLLADLGEKLIWVFENPKQALLDFGNLIKDNIQTRFEGLTELIPELGKAINLLFKGRFSEAGKVAGNAVAKVALGVDNLSGKIETAIEKTKEFVAENIKEAEAAAKVADMRAKADKIERDLIVRRSKLESEVALLRLKARQEDQFSAEERKQALLEAQVLEDELLDRQTTYLELRRDAQILENTFSRTNKENLTLEAEAIAAVNRQVAERANVARQLQRELNTIQGQVDAAEKAKQAELKSFRDAEDKYDAEQKAKQEQKQKDDKKRAAEELKLEEELQAKKIAMKFQALDQVIAITNSETALGKAAFLAKQILGVKEMIAEAQKTITFSSLVAARSSAAVAEGTAQTAKIGFPQNIPMLIGYAAQAIGIIGAVRSAIGAAKSVAGSIGGGRGGSFASVNSPSAATSQPPSFNVVGTSGTNQLAETISGQNKQPLKAYVVASDVSTAQSLERNIVTGASI